MPEGVSDVLHVTPVYLFLEPSIFLYPIYHNLDIYLFLKKGFPQILLHPVYYLPMCLF